MHFGSFDANRERLESLKASGLLSHEHGIDFDRVTQLAAAATGVPLSLVSLVTDDRQIFAGAFGLTGQLASTRQTPISHSFCQHAVKLRQPLVIPDVRSHPLVADNPAVEEFGVRAYLGFPVLGAGHHFYGAVCAIDMTPRDWRDEDIEVMRGFTSIVAALIEQHLARLYQKLLTDVILHDLKAPLGRIQMAADAIIGKAGELPPSLEAMARSLKGSADHANMLVGNLLKTDRQPAKCRDLHATAEAIASQWRPQAEKKGIAIQVDPPANRIALELSDRVMTQVLEHLIGNSIQFSPGGEVRVRIRQLGEAAIIDVEDDGPGFQAEDYPRIFQRYAPLSAKPGGGTTSAGLGLFIVKTLLESEGATIVLVSRPGESATFRITAPLRRQA